MHSLFPPMCTEPVRTLRQLSMVWCRTTVSLHGLVFCKRVLATGPWTLQRKPKQSVVLMANEKHTHDRGERIKMAVIPLCVPTERETIVQAKK